MAYKFFVVDSNLKPALINPQHNLLTGLNGAAGYYHVSQDGYSFVSAASTPPPGNGYVLSCVDGTFTWILSDATILGEAPAIEGYFLKTTASAMEWIPKSSVLTTESWTITPDGGTAYLYQWAGAANSVKGELVEVDNTWEIGGETFANQLSNLTLSNTTIDNTDSHRVYLTVTNDDPFVEVAVFNASNMLTKIAGGVGDLSSGGTIVLDGYTVDNITGSVDVVSNARTDITGYATYGFIQGCKQATVNSKALGVMYTDNAVPGASVWVVREGTAKVLLTNNIGVYPGALIGADVNTGYRCAVQSIVSDGFVGWSQEWNGGGTDQLIDVSLSLGVSGTSETSAQPVVSRTIFVDVNGDDNTAQRENMMLPYRTIQAALNAAQSGDVVKVGPGTFAEDRIYLPDIKEISLVGSGELTKIVGGIEGEAVICTQWDPYPSTSDQIITIADLYVEQNGQGSSFDFMGVPYSEGVNPGSVYVINVRTVGQQAAPLEFRCYQNVYISGYIGEGLSFRAVQQIDIVNTPGSPAGIGLWVSWLENDTYYPYPDVGTTLNVYGSNVGGVSLTGFIKFKAYGSNIGGITATLTDKFAEQGTVYTSGCNVGGAAITATGVISGDVAVFDSSSLGGFSLEKSSGPNRVTAAARNCSIPSGVTAGNGCDIDARKSYLESISTVGDGTVLSDSSLYDAAGINRVDVGALTVPSTNQVLALTAEGGLAIRMTNKTGEASVKGSVLQIDRTWIITDTVQLSSLYLENVTMSFSDAGRLYLEVINQDPDVTVWVWADEARSIKVASGTLMGGWATGGAVTLSASGGSGISGTVDVVASAVNESTGVATHGTNNGVILPTATINGILPPPLIGVMYSDSVSDGYDVWVVISGKAQVLTYAGAACGGHLILNQAAAPHNAKVLCELERTANYVNLGVGIALERVTSGLVLAKLDLRGFGSALVE